MGKHNCTIDFNEKTIKISKEIVALKGKNELPNVFRISLAETVVVPGHHEMILPAKFKGAECSDGVLGLVEPSPGFAKQHDLFLARVVAQPKENMLPVCVVNLSPTPVTLYQNLCWYLQPVGRKCFGTSQLQTGLRPRGPKGR